MNQYKVNYKGKDITMNVSLIGTHYHHEWYENGERICVPLDVPMKKLSEDERNDILDIVFNQIEKSNK